MTTTMVGGQIGSQIGVSPNLHHHNGNLIGVSQIGVSQSDLNGILALGHSNLGSCSSQSQEKDHIHGEITSHIMKRDGRAAAAVVVLTRSMMADGYRYPQMIMLQTLAAVAVVVLQKMVGNLLVLHGIHGPITALGRVANREVKLASNGMMI